MTGSTIPNGWHRHVNGGGLVQDTAHVDSPAFVDGNAQVYGNAWVESPPQGQAGRWHLCQRARGRMSVGCQDHTLEHWRDNLDKIADEYHATPLERAIASRFYAMLVDLEAKR